MRISCVVITALTLSLLSPVAHGTSSLEDPRQTSAVTRLAERLLGVDASRFAFNVTPDAQLPRHRALVRNTGPNSVSISANSGVAAAWALHRYLTQYCGALVAWSAAQVALPLELLPIVPSGQLKMTSQDVYTVMPNVVTFSYSYVWWNFSDWERHIDWMALHGVSLAYSLTGQERVYGAALKRFGLTDAELAAHFPGPAFLAWGRMGNLKAWGGPLPAAWCDFQVDLQRRILERMTSLGMTPVLQGFSGMVPDAFVQKYPNVNYTRLSDWNNFGQNYSEIYFVNPNDPMFTNLSVAVINENVKIYGPVTHHYAMDPFNEVLPSENDPAFIRTVSSAILNALLKADPQGVWILQSWFLNSASDFWTTERAMAFFEPIPKNRLLVMELWGETVDLPQRLDGFFGHNFVWTALHNFGGNNAMYGELNKFNEHGPFKLRRQFPKSMLGIGIQPEGIGQNEVVYELVMQFNFFIEEPHPLSGWIRDFASRRYGRSDANLLDAWGGLVATVYRTPTHGMLTPVLVLRPSLSLSENVDYNFAQEEAAWRQLLQTNEPENVMLNYDQVDLTRQMLQIRFYQYYTVLKRAAQAENATAVEAAGATMLSLLDSMNQLLQTDERFLLQKLINSAKSFAADPSELALYEFNVRNQLTCWGPGPHTVQDYAARMYNGLVSHYYRPRWALFLKQLTDAIRQKIPFNEDQFVLDVYATVERPFYMGNDTTGPAVPTGSPRAAVKAVERTLPPMPKEFLQAKAEDDDHFLRLWLAAP